MITNQNISTNHFAVQGKGNIVSDMGGEKVMLNISKGKYYNLGEIGGEIWELIKKPTQILVIINTLTVSYLVEPNACEEHVLLFLEQLLVEGLVVISPDNAQI